MLEKHLHMELESIEGGVASRKKLKKEKRKERRLKKAARLAEEARLAFDILRGPSVPDPTALIQTPPPKLVFLRIFLYFTLVHLNEFHKMLFILYNCLAESVRVEAFHFNLEVTLC